MGKVGYVSVFLVAVVWVVLGDLGQGLGGWGGLDYLCRWQVQVSVVC